MVIDDFPDFDGVQAAAARLLGVASKTPLLRADALDDLIGAPVFVKAEPLQRTGSFKFRGAYNRLVQLSGTDRARGVYCFSAGNHGQGVAAAAKLLGIPAVVVLPTIAPQVKVDGVRRWGAETIIYERSTEAFQVLTAQLRARGLIEIHPFDDRAIIEGQGTCGLEIAEQLAALGESAEVLLCPTSGGGLLSGVALAVKTLAPSVAIYAVEPDGFTDFALSLARGAPTRLDSSASSLCDALLAPMPGRLTFAAANKRVAGAVSAGDNEVLAAMAFAFQHLKLVLEPGGAIGLAALIARKVVPTSGAAVVVASGGGVDSALFRRMLGAVGT